MSKENMTETWPELAAGLYDSLTGRNAEIAYEFDQMDIAIPSHAGANASHALWKLNGTLKIRTRDHSAASN